MGQWIRRRRAAVAWVAVAVAAAALVVTGVLARPALARSASSSALRVMTFNVRFDFKNDGKNRWNLRKEAVAKTIGTSQVDIVCLQEDKEHQVDDLKALLPEYSFVGRGRNANGSSERCAIGYKTRGVRLRERGDFWLSDTPDVPGSNTWGDRYPRKVTWALLEHKSKKKTVLVLNTHLPEGRKTSLRRQAAVLMRSWLDAHVKKIVGEQGSKRARNVRVIVAGDFNTDVGTEPFELLSESALLPLRDAWKEANTGGITGTYHDFRGLRTKKRIDWLLVGGAVRVAKVMKIEDKIDGRYPSDHYPIVAAVELR